MMVFKRGPGDGCVLLEVKVISGDFKDKESIHRSTICNISCKPVPIFLLHVCHQLLCPWEPPWSEDIVCIQSIILWYHRNSHQAGRPPSLQVWCWTPRRSRQHCTLSRPPSLPAATPPGQEITNRSFHSETWLVELAHGGWAPQK